MNVGDKVKLKGGRLERVGTVTMLSPRVAWTLVYVDWGLSVGVYAEDELEMVS